MDESRMEIRLLGPVGVTLDGEEALSGSGALRTFLALLALTPGTVVGTATLIDELWGSTPPRDPRAALHVQATRLRKWLAPHGRRPGPLRSERGGYALDVDPAHVDLLRFHACAARALGEAGSLTAAEEAVALWSGDPLEGCVASSRLEAERARAEERFLRVAERRATLLLEAGRPADAVEAVLPLVDEHRSREGLTATAMTALYRDGRQREALATYDDTRRYLRDGFGLEPGTDLAALHQRILEQAPGLVPAPRGPVTGARPLLVGRERTVEVLLDGLGGRGRLVLVEGETGVGRTSVLRAAAAAAAGRGARIAGGAWDDDLTPCSAWWEAFEALGVEPPGGAGQYGAWVHAQLGVLARQAPVVVALDDAHRADAASLGVLRTLLRHGIPDRLLVLVSSRTSAPTAPAAWDHVRADLLCDPGVERVALDDLSPDAVARLAADRCARFGPAAARRLGEVVWHRTAGRALHVAALLEAVADQDDERAAGAAAGRVPDRLRPVLDLQVACLPAECRRLLEALAELGAVTTTALAGVADRTEGEVADGVRPALDAGVLVARGELLVFRHPLVEAVVADGIPDVSRRRWRRAHPATADRRVGEVLDLAGR